MDIWVIGWVNEQNGMQVEAFTDGEIAQRCMGYVMEHSSNSAMRKFRVQVQGPDPDKIPAEGTAEEEHVQVELEKDGETDEH